MLGFQGTTTEGRDFARKLIASIAMLPEGPPAYPSYVGPDPEAPHSVAPSVSLWGSQERS